MVNLREAYSRGERMEVWDELSSVENCAHSDLLADARAVAVTAMRRVRANIELLIRRWESAGHVFGYHWVDDEAKRCISRLARLTPLLGDPGDEDVEQLDRFERVKGPLPIALRAFYDVVGSVNFVGKIANGWPDECTLDPLQVLAFSPQVEGLSRGRLDTIEICEDPCHKYLYSGLDSLVVSVPSGGFDPVLQLEGGELEFDGRPLTFGWYLRHVVLNRGGIGLSAGYNNDPIDTDLLNYLTEGLQPF